MAFLNQDNEDQQTQDTSQAPNPSLNTPTQGTAASGGATAPAAPQNPANQPKGSGRFTNIQKYINANQGAGSRLAGGIDKKIEGQINPELQKANDNMSSLRQGIQAGQNTINEGNQLNSQVQDTNFDATNYAQNQDNVDKFTQFRTGGALDETALRQQAQTAQQQALAAQQKTQALNQQFGTEQGRQDLLKQTFSPGRNYSVGQQRLDNLFLQQASPEIKNIQGNINQANAQLGSLNSQFGTQAKSVEDLANQETGITSGIQSGISAREQDLLNSVNAKQDQVNKDRIAQQATYRDQFGNLVDGKNINQDFANLVDLKDNDRLMNVLKNDANVDDYLKFNDTLLTSPDQLANQQERAKYDAIARLAGIDPSARAINMNTQVANAVDSTGKLRSDVDTARAAYENTKTNNDINSNWINASSKTNLGQAQNLIDTLGINQQGIDSVTGTPSGYINGNWYTGGPGIYSIGDDPVSNALKQMQGQTNTGIVNPLEVNTAKLNALRDAYKQLADKGYFQRVNVDDPTLENTPKVT